MTHEELAREIESSVEWLVATNCGCCTIKLNDRLALCVGWSDYDGMEYRICSGIKVWTSDDLRTDFDWLNSPYDVDGDVWNTDVCITDDNDDIDVDLIDLAKYYLNEFESLAKFDIDERGALISTYN